MEEQIFNRTIEFLEKAERCNELSNRINYGGLTISEVHCLDYIGKLKTPNVTGIAQAMKMTRGGITKLTTKLAGKGYIEKHSIPGNKKEVHFCLTDSGRKVYLKHERVHEEARMREVEFYSTFSQKEQETINKFLEKLNEFTLGRIEELEEKQ